LVFLVRPPGDLSAASEVRVVEQRFMGEEAQAISDKASVTLKMA
jgi:hypothetical protein